MRQNQPAKAVPWFRRALLEEPGNSLRHLTLAAALAGAGEIGRRRSKKLARQSGWSRCSKRLTGCSRRVDPERARYWKQEYAKLAPRRLQR